MPSKKVIYNNDNISHEANDKNKKTVTIITLVPRGDTGVAKLTPLPNTCKTASTFY